MPLNPTQEIQAIERYYAELYLDASLPDFGRQPLTYLSFDCQDVRDALRDMPRMKDLAPDDFLAYIWKHFADDLAPYVRATFEYCWLGNEIIPPPHWIVGPSCLHRYLWNLLASTSVQLCPKQYWNLHQWKGSRMKASTLQAFKTRQSLQNTF